MNYYNIELTQDCWDIVDSLEDPNKTVYVEINDGSAHDGSIGFVKSYSQIYYYGYGKYDDLTSIEKLCRLTFTIGFKGKPNKIKRSFHDFDFLKDYTGPCVLNYVKPEPAPKPEPKPLLDKFDSTIEIGATAFFSTSSTRYSADVLVGRVSKISKTGTVYCTPFNFCTITNEVRIRNNSDIVIFSDELESKILLAKLSH